ncbi:M23 family metallopeptidase [Salinactinospora qingdaonensis]|uniref:M23ase beta-sheet core domain-containing protein n=1 Tax=Salinactinospora qingdaonensis TaxID=702744 RepID=A0ABP7GJB8_9ACTN
MTLLLLNAALILAVVGVVHWYLYKRLVKDTSRAGDVWRRTGTALVWLLAAITLGAMVVGPADAPFEVVRAFEWPSRIWLNLLPYLVIALLLGELARPLLRQSFTHRVASSPRGPSNGAPPEVADAAPAAPGVKDEDAGGKAAGANEAKDSETSRRIFIARGVGLGATTLAGGITYVGTMAGDSPSQKPGDRGIELSLPFTGRWHVENSPARRVPSHGTDLFGGRYAIDFVGVDRQHRTAGSRSWRTFLATEPPELFFAFGRPILAPGNGTVVAVHDGEPDHEARRSQPALIPYALSQGARVREGVNAIAGNYVIISLAESDVFVALVHFQAGSIRVSVGQQVVEGEHIANCGNSGNSTQPHVHVQAMDSADLSVAKGVPMQFRRFREWPSGVSGSRVRERAIPGERAVVEPLSNSSKTTGR